MSRMIPWRDESPENAHLAGQFLLRHSTLHALVTGGGEVLDVVIQDEYTHDVIARIPTSTGAIIAVFDST